MGITFALIAAAIIASVIGLELTGGLQLKQLIEDGVDIDGVIVRQFKLNPKGGSQPRSLIQEANRRSARRGIWWNRRGKH